MICARPGCDKKAELMQGDVGRCVAHHRAENNGMIIGPKSTVK